jgi:hypothetical protein
MFVARKIKNTECHNPGKCCFPPKQEQVYTVKRPILKSSLLRQIAPLEFINTLFKKSKTKKPR